MILEKLMRLCKLSILALPFSISACAAIIDGTSQQIAINSNPPGAECAVYRNGEKIGTVQQTPSSVLVKKSKHDLWIECAKPGYENSRYLNHSGLAGSVFGNIALGGFIGVAVDSASGADNKYDPAVNISLTKSDDPKKEAVLPQFFANGDGRK
ncbi:PEGA domain-containing protein [Candidatus Kirkpatrickella diaphorinae]|uniref:PEGA domain-containing protein n=1 Tax=Candidatus Kirkpatrickella diaphorinae TaxID=2984322 RepID=A0ABY6GKY3_9PROT|nr:PEGA domain-containing protein [Candidatus Kirkpatrickella diaphorinae]UYH51666.1 PEGA domain-containing protein [Candidatus Kirkpatrickella diaphorinae]